MAKKVFLQHPSTQQIKTGLVGFSWTTFFFQGFVPLFRGDWKAFIVILAITLTLLLPQMNLYYIYISQGVQDSFAAISVADRIWRLLSSFWSAAISIGGGFFYNKIYTRNLIAKGWRPLTEGDEEMLRRYNIKVPSDYELHSFSKHE